MAILAGDAVAAAVPPAVLTKRKFTIAKVEIAKPTGDPVTAGSADNEFTFMTAAGVATIPVEATITPTSLAASVGPTIKWTFVSLPAGTVLTWNNPWPGEATAGQGRTAIATLTGYPTNNSGFGLKTIKMEVLQGIRVIATKTANIELFFEKNMTATGRVAPNWFFYWLQAIGGRANTIYSGAGGGSFGDAPGMLNWSYGTAPDKTRLNIYDAAAVDDPGEACTTRGIRATTGIDTFEDTVVHENHHTIQIANADTALGITPGTPWRFGWSWNRGANNNHWRVGPDGKPGVSGVDDDGNGTVDDLIVTGRGELGRGDDIQLSDTGDPILNWPIAFGALPPLCWPGPAGGVAVERPAYEAEPDNEGGRAGQDWADPGKQHRTASAAD